MKLRIAKRQDFDQIMGLLRQLNPSDLRAPKLELEAFNHIFDSNYLELIVADDGGTLLGSCYLNIIPNITRGGRPYAVIENVITDSQHRNRGVGKALIKTAMDKAWSHNCYKVMLMSGRAEESVHAFYKKCGFNADEKQAYILRSP